MERNKTEHIQIGRQQPMPNQILAESFAIERFF